MDRHRASCADAVGTVDRLVFDGRVPPTVEQKDIAGELKVEADAARAVAHQHDMRVGIAAELFDDRVTPLRGDFAVVFQRIKTLKFGGQFFDRVDPLAEDDRLASTGGAFFEVGFKPVELTAFAG